MTNPSLCQAVFSKTSGVGSCFEHFFIPRSHRLPPTPTDIHKRPQTIVHGMYMAILVTLRILEDKTTVYSLSSCHLDFQACLIQLPSQERLHTQDVRNHLGTLHFVHHSTKLVFLSPQGPEAVVDRLLRRPHDLSHWVPLSKKNGSRAFSNSLLSHIYWCLAGNEGMIHNNYQ
jgi:hypothetical protein